MEAKALLSKEKVKAIEAKKGRALKIKAKNEDHARVQRLLDEAKGKVTKSNLTAREKKIKRAKEVRAAANTTTFDEL